MIIMLRRVVAAGTALLIGASASANLTACGDKFLRIGRSSRFNGYAPIHPSSIVLFLPKQAKASAIQEFEQALKRAGHTFQAVATTEALSSALNGGIDIVIAAAVDAPQIRSYAEAASSKPNVLPITDDASKGTLARIQQEYGHVLKLPATKRDTLAEIDHVMDGRLRGRPAGGSGS